MTSSTGTDVATSVRKEVLVAAPPAVAFEVFTARFGDWWPGHQIGPGDIAAFVLEQREGGRWFERNTDGAECDWGHVVVWQPPHRLVLTWAIDARWRPDPERASEVEVTFAEADGGRTRVVLEHRHLDRAGQGWQAMRDQVGGEGGWGHILAGYADVVATG